MRDFMNGLGGAALVTVFVCGVAFLLFGCTAMQVRRAMVDGQLFCSMQTTNGPLTATIVDLAGVPVSVINRTSAAVAAMCAMINALPVPPPADADNVLIVAVKPVGA